MDDLLKFLQNYFNVNVLVLFLISSFFLIYIDCKEYKEAGLTKEYKFSKYIGVGYIVIGFAVYGLVKFIR